MQETYIDVKNLTIRYDSHVVVRDLSFSIAPGDYLCILGENGSGKSTLIKALLGLKAPAEGHIHFGGGLRQSEIGYMPQQTGIQRDFPASVREVVLSGCINSASWKPFYGAREKRIAHESMEKLNITDLAGECYRFLSGGQQQRVLLARALCATGKMLLLDEPVTGLDPIATAEFYALIQSINQTFGITIVMVSHDVHSALSYSNRILHLGNPTFFGDTSDYLKSTIGESFTGKEDAK